MIDIDKIKPGDYVWIIGITRLFKIKIDDVVFRKNKDGLHVLVIGEGIERSIDLCFETEYEAIEHQIQYWSDMKLNNIAACVHEWRVGKDNELTYVCVNCGSSRMVPVS